VPRGDNNWYKHCGLVMKKLSKEYPKSNLLLFLVSHMIELLLFDEKINVMNYIYSLESIPQGSFERYTKNYFEKNTISTKKYTVFIGYKLNKRMIMILNDNNKWVEASPEEQREIASLKETKDFFCAPIFRSRESGLKLLGDQRYPSQKTNHKPHLELLLFALGKQDTS
jgi:hypothetical protein